MHYLAPLLPYTALLTVLTGVLFGILTIRQWQRARYLTAAVELVHSMQDGAFVRSVQKILELPEHADPDAIFADREAVYAAYVVGHVFESLGVLVFYHLLPLQLVDHLVGGYLRASWNRLEPYVEVQRARLGPTFAEWFHWLAERVQERPLRQRGPGVPKAYRSR